MKKIDLCEIQKRRYDNYLKEEKNLIVTRTEHGYSVSNLNKATTYKVSKNSESGDIECECKDFCNYKKQGIYIRCKHIICVGRKCSNKGNNANSNPSKVSVSNKPSEEQVGNKPAIETINNIIKEEYEMTNNSKFNPQNHLMKVKGKDYLEVKYRVHWFRIEHPDYSIKTEITHLDIEKGIVIIKADVYDSTGKHLSTGHKMEYQKHFFDYAEKSETGAIGRALACLGYGTLQCFDMEEGADKGRIVDAPVTPPVYPKAPAAPTYTTTTPKLPAPTATPTQKPTAINPVSKTQSAGSGGNGKGGNGKTGKDNQQDINDIIKRW